MAIEALLIEEGLAARQAHVAQTANPFAATPLAAYWDLGWRTADAAA